MYTPGSKISNKYFPSKSEVVPLEVPLIKTLANARGSLLNSLSVSKPDIAPVSWAEILKQTKEIRVKNKDFICCDF